MIFAIKSAWYRGQAKGLLTNLLQHYENNSLTEIRPQSLSNLVVDDMAMAFPNISRRMVEERVPVAYFAVFALAHGIEGFHRFYGLDQMDHIAALTITGRNILGGMNHEYTKTNQLAAESINQFLISCDLITQALKDHPLGDAVDFIENYESRKP